MSKKILSLLLAFAILLSVMPTVALAAGAGLGNFKKTETYTDGRFSDVPKAAWYADTVQTAYELNLVKGVSDTTYNPSGNITIAATLALACRIHSIYQTGEAEFVQGSPWYQVYVDYAVKNGIITANQFTNYNAPATRRQFAAILAKALPASALTQKNTVDDGMIPDLEKGSANYDDIYRLYRAGVLTGNDDLGTFTPEKPIQRSAVATIVSRMALPELRQSITLKAVPVTKVTLNSSELTMKVGKTATLTASVQPSNATAKVLTWKSSNTSVATVNDNGVVTGVKKGTATITATAPSGVKATCTVTVVDKIVPVTSISLSRSYLTLDINETERLTVSFYPSNATDQEITWSSSSSSVASVSSSGTVTANKEGTATITAKTSNGKTATCRVTVNPPVEVSSVTVSPGYTTLKVGETESLSCTVRPSNAYDKSITWSSSDTSVATVSSSGVVTAKGAGTARITAKSSNGKSDYCSVTVEKSLLPEFTMPKMNYNYGPMTVTAYYSSGKVQYINTLTRLEFTDTYVYSDGEYVSLKAMVQGTSTTDKLYVKVNLYSSSGALLDSDDIAVSVTPNKEFAVENNVMFSSSALKQASKIEFVSYSNNPATSGTETPPTPTDPDSYETYYGFGIPSFDQFTSCSRTVIKEETNVCQYSYDDVSTSEVNAYISALEACGYSHAEATGTHYFTKGVSGNSDYREVRLFTFASPYGTAAGVIISKIKPSNEWGNSDSGSGGGSSNVGGYPSYDGFAIPDFGEFTSGRHIVLDSDSENVQGHLYDGVTQQEIDRYFSVLESCGFSHSGSIPGGGSYSIERYTCGTEGTDDYMEVRFATTPGSSGGLAANLSISRIKPSNEW